MRLALIDTRVDAQAERALQMRGFRVVRMPVHPALGADVASHPDMLLFAHGGRIITSSEYAERVPWLFSDIREYSDNAVMTFTDEKQCEKYPYDCIFNALVLGDKIYCKKDTVSSAVLSYAEECGYETVNVKQGYPACTVLPLGNDRAVTSDRGMARVLEKEGVKVTLIREGHILLPTREYGFIGGSAGICDGVVYFLGNIERHPDAGQIVEAIKDAGMTYVSLSDAELSDGGRVIFI